MLRIALYPPVNTGALVQVKRSGSTIHLDIVEVSAASHVSPVYTMAQEAPRIYGDRVSMRDVRWAWLMWIAEMICDPDSRDRDDLEGVEMLHYAYGNATQSEKERALRTFIVERLDRIPEVKKEG